MSADLDDERGKVLALTLDDEVGTWVVRTTERHLVANKETYLTMTRESKNRYSHQIELSMLISEHIFIFPGNETGSYKIDF